MFAYKNESSFCIPTPTATPTPTPHPHPHPPMYSLVGNSNHHVHNLLKYFCVSGMV